MAESYSVPGRTRMWWMGMAVGQAATIEVPMAVSLPIGQPSHGVTDLRVPLPSRVRKGEPVTAGIDGFTLACDGDGRWADITFSYDVAAVPEHLPDALQCTVGSHTVVLRLTNDLEVAAGSAAPLTLRLTQGFAAWPMAGPDGPGRVVDARGVPVDLLVCRFAKGSLWAEIRPGLQPGSYRCLSEGREPQGIEVLPAE